MTGKKLTEAESIYSGGSTKRSRIFDDISCSSNVSIRWRRIFSCCFRSLRAKKVLMRDYNPNEFDYIIEKLVVKRVPLALFATEQDVYEFNEEENEPTNDEPVLPPLEIKQVTVNEVATQQVFSAMPEIQSSLFFARNKSRNDVSRKPSSKNLRFNKDEDLLDEDAVNAGPSSYENDSQSRDELASDFLNELSSLHPDLKDGERPPKDPCPLNPPRSKRSLAENISEMASTKKSPIFGRSKGKCKKKNSNIYITVSDTSREISTVLGDEEIPTRDKCIPRYRSNSICRKIGSASCLPFAHKSSKAYGAETEDGHPHALNYFSTVGSQCQDHGSAMKPSFIVPPLQVHYVSPKQKNTAGVSQGDVDAGYRNQRKNNLELLRSGEEEISPYGDESLTDGTSITSEDLAKEGLAGTTLRWKIIIKHHQPSASQTTTESTSELPEASAVPMLSDALHGTPRAGVRQNTTDKMERDEKINFKADEDVLYKFS